MNCLKRAAIFRTDQRAAKGGQWRTRA
eukprot:COSAG06_NODE_45502_length_354_cov_0.823529_1_plen_26_part_10